MRSFSRYAGASLAVLLALSASHTVRAGDLPPAPPASGPGLDEAEQSAIAGDITSALRDLQFASLWVCDTVDQGRVDAQYRRLRAAEDAFRARGGKPAASELLLIDASGCQRSSDHLDETLNSASKAITHMRRLLRLRG